MPTNETCIGQLLHQSQRGGVCRRPQMMIRILTIIAIMDPSAEDGSAIFFITEESLFIRTSNHTWQKKRPPKENIQYWYNTDSFYRIKDLNKLGRPTEDKTESMLKRELQKLDARLNNVSFQRSTLQWSKSVKTWTLQKRNYMSKWVLTSDAHILRNRIQQPHWQAIWYTQSHCTRIQDFQLPWGPNQIQLAFKHDIANWPPAASAED